MKANAFRGLRVAVDVVMAGHAGTLGLNDARDLTAAKAWLDALSIIVPKEVCIERFQREILGRLSETPVARCYQPGYEREAFEAAKGGASSFEAWYRHFFVCIDCGRDTARELHKTGSATHACPVRSPETYRAPASESDTGSESPR